MKIASFAFAYYLENNELYRHSVFKIIINAGVLACNCCGPDSIPDTDIWQGSDRSKYVGGLFRSGERIGTVDVFDLLVRITIWHYSRYGLNPITLMLPVN